MIVPALFGVEKRHAAKTSKTVNFSVLQAMEGL